MDGFCGAFLKSKINYLSRTNGEKGRESPSSADCSQKNVCDAKRKGGGRRESKEVRPL